MYPSSSWLTEEYSNLYEVDGCFQLCVSCSQLAVKASPLHLLRRYRMKNGVLTKDGFTGLMMERR
jgi:hypothetical protein